MEVGVDLYESSSMRSRPTSLCAPSTWGTQQNTVFATLVSLTKRFEANEASLSTISTDSLCLRIAEVPRCRDLAIFVRTTDDRRQTTDNRQWAHKPIALPLLRMRAHGVKMEVTHIHSHTQTPTRTFEINIHTDALFVWLGTWCP
jgi:hypothetical protein